MAIEYRGAGIPVSFASCSITSKPNGGLLQRMKSIKKSGFDGMVVSMPYIVELAKTQTGGNISEEGIEQLTEASKLIRDTAETIHLKLLMLQLFPRFEGLTAKRRDGAFAKAADWLRIMKALGVNMLQVGSSDAEDISRNSEVLTADLNQLAQLCSHNGCKVAYENWCWSTHAPSWKAAWDIVKKVDHPNLGLCLDTYKQQGLNMPIPPHNRATSRM